MAVNKRGFEHIIQVLGGLLIEASAGAGKVLTSDAEGNATWKALPTKKRIHEHSFTLQGEFATGEYPGYSVAVAEGEEKKLVGFQYRLLGGTSAVVKLKLNGTAVSESEVTAKNEAVKTVTFVTPTVLAAKDHFTLEVVTATAPKNLEYTVLVESIG